ncbi:unnamed protein product [Agarophyton chilense]
MPFYTTSKFLDSSKAVRYVLDGVQQAIFVESTHPHHENASEAVDYALEGVQHGIFLDSIKPDDHITRPPAVRMNDHQVGSDQKDAMRGNTEHVIKLSDKRRTSSLMKCISEAVGVSLLNNLVGLSEDELKFTGDLDDLTDMVATIARTEEYSYGGASLQACSKTDGAQ